jgi:hypothetical protein
MALRLLLPCALLFVMACGEPGTPVNNADSAFMDSMLKAHEAAYDSSLVSLRDTVFHTALPPVFEGDIIMQQYGGGKPKLWSELMGGKYNHVGIILMRPRDGILMVVDVTDTVRFTELTTYVDRAEDGHVAVLRLKDAKETLDEEKVKSLKETAKGFRGVPGDAVLNWDDTQMYPAELVWKVYNNALKLALCKKTTVASFGIAKEKQKELSTNYGGTVNAKDEAVSIDDIYNSPKLEIIYEK